MTTSPPSCSELVGEVLRQSEGVLILYVLQDRALSQLELVVDELRQRLCLKSVDIGNPEDIVADSVTFGLVDAGVIIGIPRLCAIGAAARVRRGCDLAQNRDDFLV